MDINSLYLIITHEDAIPVYKGKDEDGYLVSNLFNTNFLPASFKKIGDLRNSWGDYVDGSRLGLYLIKPIKKKK